MGQEKKLTPKRQRFVENYCVHLNATKAAIEAGYSMRTADRIGPELLGISCVAKAIAAKQNIVAERAEVNAADVLKRMFDIATADPNDLIAHRLDACRYCHGERHQFQWVDEAEYGEAVARAIEAAGDGPPTLPTKEGGFGFDPEKGPHQDCPRCFGSGVSRIEVADTKRLEGKARLLYAGVKATKYGVEVLMHDQMKALEMVGRHLGMFTDTLKVRGDIENPFHVLVQAVQGSMLRPTGQRSIAPATFDNDDN